MINETNCSKIQELKAILIFLDTYLGIQDF